jgi:hypothetical protein
MGIAVPQDPMTRCLSLSTLMCRIAAGFIFGCLCCARVASQIVFAVLWRSGNCCSGSHVVRQRTVPAVRGLSTLTPPTASNECLAASLGRGCCRLRPCMKQEKGVCVAAPRTRWHLWRSQLLQSTKGQRWVVVSSLDACRKRRALV